MRSLGPAFLRFCIVGAFGFAVDAVGLVMLMAVGLDPLLARIGSILIAVTTTWACHRFYTFGSRAAAPVPEWARFVLVNAIGMTINYATYAILLTSVDGLSPLAALVGASVVALGVNFAGARHFAFRPTAPSQR